MEQVLVTGATGFIGLHVISGLLQAGYKVRGTIRTPAREKEVISALKNKGVDCTQIELVQADLLAADSWESAVKGCDYIQHIASPFMVGVPKHEDEMVKPAVEGVKNVVSAGIRHQVKKIVLTSSCAAITQTYEGKTHFSEEDWTDPHHPKTSAYYKSKTLAEQEAWKLIKAQKGSAQTALTVLNPAGVIGPTLSADIGVANEFVRKILVGEVPGCPRMHLGFVDVRDVAEAHILAMSNKKADGMRLIINEREFWFKEFCEVLREAGHRKAPTRNMPDFLVRLFGLFDPATKQIAEMLGEERFTPADKAKEILNWQPRDARISIRETANQIIELGLAK